MLSEYLQKALERSNMIMCEQSNKHILCKKKVENTFPFPFARSIHIYPLKAWQLRLFQHKYVLDGENFPNAA